MPGTVLGTGDIMVKKKKKIYSLGSTVVYKLL